MTNLVDRLPLLPRAGRSRGLTLIEMLVALAVTLVMMAAVVNLFANMSASIRNRRAAIETGAQLRQTRNRLAMDLSGATSRGSTWQDPAENQGYIEIIEGEWSDKNPSSQILPANVNTANGIDTTISNIPSSQAFNSETGDAAGPAGIVNIGPGAVTDGRALGDWDDILALTVRSESDPFTARYNNALIESPLAEVVWLAREQRPSTPADPNDGMRRIYRRVLLIAPWLDAVGNNINDPPNNISAHWDPSRNGGAGQWVANTLSDLTKRENRVARQGNSLFPHIWDPHNNPANFDFQRILPANTAVDALVLNNALAFDVRVFDPGAPLYEIAGSIVDPTDIGWEAAYKTDVNEPSNNFFDDFIGQGAYVDMGYATKVGITTIPPNRNPPAPQPVRPVFSFQSTLAGQPNDSIYDTWSYHYENDGINQDAAATDAWRANTVDQGANGLDDEQPVGLNGVDDRGERETSPPYDVPLRGVKVILRVYEPDSRQIRESSVTHSFKQ